MNKTTWQRKFQAWIIALGIVLLLLPINAVPASANPASNFFRVTRNPSYTKDGKYYMSFTIQSLYTLLNSTTSAKLYDAAGKVIFTWSAREFTGGSTIDRNYCADYGSLPTGKYTFKLNCTAGFSDRSWNWSYTINHTRNESFGVKSYEKFNDNGRIIHKWYVQCTNLKGQKVTMKIYDPSGKLVYNSTGPARATGNEVGWFSWSGYNTIGQRYKCPSGTYLVQLTASNSKKVIEKQFKLIIT